MDVYNADTPGMFKRNINIKLNKKKKKKLTINLTKR